MGKFEIQSMPVQRPENNYSCGYDKVSVNGSVRNGNNGLVRIIEEGLATLQNGRNPDSVDEDDEDLSGKKLDVEMPEGMKLLSNQVAGHVIEDSGGVGMLSKDDKVYKPLLKKDCAEREIRLYEQLETTVDRSLIEMRHLVPKYYGVEKIMFKDKLIDYLVLENLTKDFKEPCVMDIKIGRRTWDPYASYSKIIAEEKKYHECKRDLGFCIPGLQVYKIAQNRLVKYGKDFGKTLDKDSAKEVIKEFLNADCYHFCRKLLMQLLACLWQIQHFARNQRRLRLYASSILLVYDARRLKEHLKPARECQNNRISTLTRHTSLYRPLSLATLNNGCEKVVTGFSGQLTK